MGTWSGINELSGDDMLTYVRLKLDSDAPTRSRGYDALMQMLYQGMHSGDLMGMLSGHQAALFDGYQPEPVTAMTLAQRSAGG